MPTLSIAVIGSGVIGRTLASCFSQAGHTVTFGARNPSDADLAEAAEQIGATVGAVNAAIEAADVVVWAIPGGAMPEAIPAAAAYLDGKVAIDATNRVGEPRLHSLDLIAEHAPGAHAYRAFNSVGWENFADPHYGEVTGDLLYTGPDGPSREIAETVIGATGLRPVRVGDNDKATLVDNVAALWFALAFDQGMGRGVGFKVLTR
ncbi:NADPH-dependent F420 reductase [Actinospica robiniae]|uniref:NADPH-dependent F420 reductase n=1 Tax=Actinospica robiniae TaxID=304901 RepID=UPI0003F8E287|nr:NAD(P)-binding domain-containing protein [Actinospica robiniae]